MKITHKDRLYIKVVLVRYQHHFPLGQPLDIEFLIKAVPSARKLPPKNATIAVPAIPELPICEWKRVTATKPPRSLPHTQQPGGPQSPGSRPPPPPPLGNGKGQPVPHHPTTAEKKSPYSLLVYIKLFEGHDTSFLLHETRTKMKFRMIVYTRMARII